MDEVQIVAQATPTTPGRMASYAVTEEALRQLKAAHVPILAGTDASMPAAATARSVWNDFATRDNQVGMHAVVCVLWYSLSFHSPCVFSLGVTVGAADVRVRLLPTSCRLSH